MQDRKLVEFENTYMQGAEELALRAKGDDLSGAIASVTIDGYPAETDGGEDDAGRVVCIVWMTTDGKFIVDWPESGYGHEEKVRELIEDAKKKLLEAFGENAK